MKIKDIAISLLCVALAMALVNHVWNTIALPSGQPTAVPQVIYVPVPDTAVPSTAPGMATAVPWEEWAGEPATAVPETVIIAAPATWTPEATGPRLVQGCSLSRGTCPGQGQP